MRRRGPLILAAAALAAALALPAALQADPAATGPNIGPKARLSASPRNVTAGGSVLLDGSRSLDPDGRIVRYVWDLNGDGIFETGTGRSAKLRDILAAPGDVEVGLRVIDDRGAFSDDKVRLSASTLRDDTLSSYGSAGGGVRGARLKAATQRRGGPKAGGSAPGGAPLHAAAATAVTIKDFNFAPTAVTVQPGDTVTWTNQGPTGHSATANDGSFNTGILKKGSSGSFRFTKAGTFAYHCTPHPNMKATVVVAGSGGTSAAGTPGSTPGTGTNGSGSNPGSSGSNGSPGGSPLPHTGLELASLALLGLALIGGGVVLRRRLSRNGGASAP